MQRKKVAFFIIVLLILFSINSFAETKKLRRIGVNPFARIRGDIPTSEVMKTIAEKYANDIQYGFEQVGMSDLYPLFLNQLKTATLAEKSISLGEIFPWMLFRISGKVKVWQDVEWAGNKPLEVFSMIVNKDNKNYEFVIPKICVNVALYNIKEIKIIPPAIIQQSVSQSKTNMNEPITIDLSGTKNAKSMEVEIFDDQGNKIGSQILTPDSPKLQFKFDKPGDYIIRSRAWNEEGKPSENVSETKIHINFPPECKLQISCLVCQDFIGKPITFDASGSQDKDGQIVKTTFEVMDSSGKVLDSFVDTAKPFTWEKVFYTAGKYTISAIVYDDMGAFSGGTGSCKAAFEVTQKKFFPLLEAGILEVRGSLTHYFFGRVGMLWSFLPNKLDLILSGGGALPSRKAPWKFLFVANAILNLELGRSAYVGAGLGYSTKAKPIKKSGTDLVGQFGVNVFNHWTSAGSIFAEGRIPILDSNRKFDEHKKFSLGFRYIF